MRVKRLVAVRDFMSQPPLTVDSETSVADACKLMGEKHIGSILVSSKGVANAIFTERDLISRVLPETKDLARIKVGTCASSPLITVAATTDVKEAARIMTQMKVRRLVVVRDGKPIGIFTAADLAKAAGKSPLEL
jgi:CBS domain-containing protein